MHREITISIIIPCYNQSNFLNDAVESIINQSYTNWECIIVNDGSSDSTEENAIKLTLKDKRILYFKKNNGGLASARNFGINKSSGKYILPLDSDDKIHKDYIEHALQIFTLKTETKLIYCGAVFFGDLSGSWDLPEYSYSRLLHSNHIFCSCIFRKEDFLKTGGYDESFKRGWEDWEFLIRLLNKNDLVYKIPKNYFYYRIRKNSMVRSMSEEIKKEYHLKIFTKNLAKYLESYDIIEIISNHEKIESENKNLVEEISALIKSRPYKLGQMLLYPLKKLQKTIF